jgi:hypothetical protein
MEKNLGQLLSEYKTEAFRLEGLPEYNVISEVESLDAFKKDGTLLPVQDTEEYILEQSKKIIEGKRHIRARIIPQPITIYFKFETQIGYIPQSKNNFELYFLERGDLTNGRLNEAMLLKDFWLLDRNKLAFMIYGEDGTFKGVKFSDDSDLILQANEIRNYFVENGKSLDYVLQKFF